MEGTNAMSQTPRQNAREANAGVRRSKCYCCGDRFTKRSLRYPTIAGDVCGHCDRVININAEKRESAASEKEGGRE